MKNIKYLSIIITIAFAFTQEVNLQITNYSDGVVELSIQNLEPVAGIQFNLNSTFEDFAITGAYGGLAEAAGFSLSSSATTILGFSFSGTSIPPGEGVLCYINTVSLNDDEGILWISTPIFSSPSGQGYDVNVGDEFIIETEEDLHFNLEIAETGSSTLFIFEDSITELNNGDEVGLFDANGYLDENGSMGELLVGAGVWNGSQLNVIGIMGEDLSSFGGPILPGAIQGNDLVLKIWKFNDEVEIISGFTVSTGSGTFDELFTIIFHYNGIK